MPLYRTTRRRGAHRRAGVTLACACLIGACPGVGRAEEGDAATPLVLNVRPSGVEEDPRERRLRRARDLDFAFRSICVGCGPSARARNAGKPFTPLNALAPRPARQDPPELPAQAAAPLTEE